MTNKFNPWDLVVYTDEAKKDLSTLNWLDHVFLILWSFWYEDNWTYEYINLNTNTTDYASWY